MADALRYHLAGACDAGCPYCAKRRRIRNGLLEEVAHRAWHLLDDGGEGDDNLWVGTQRQADALSAALDALEADGWRGGVLTHGDDER